MASGMGLEGKLALQRKKRFSTYLMSTFVVLATLSVVVILAALHLYFGRQVELEFHKKLMAQKGQTEIILENRIAEVHEILKKMGSDNIIRVTVMLGARSQLAARITQAYPSEDGVFPFVEREGESSLVPAIYPGISHKTIGFALTQYPYGEILKEGDQTRLLWLFSTPIMHQNQRMGLAYVLYDMAQDHRLIDSVRSTVGGNVSVITADRLLSLTTGTAMPLNTDQLKKISRNNGFHALGRSRVVSKMIRFNNLYFQSSLASLAQDKRKVTVWIAIFSIVILAVSTLASVFLAKKMVNPLRQMTRKAIQISEGQKNLRFETDRKNYWEFNQLSQAFNYMLVNLKNAEEQTRYKELLENVDDAVYILAKNGDIVEANEAAYSQFGCSPEQFFQLNLTDIIPPQDARLIMDRLGGKKDDKNLKKLTLQTCHNTRHGSCIPVEIHSRAITYRERKVILNVARDVSKRIKVEKALRESEERYRSVVENSHDGIVILNNDLGIIYVNGVLAQMLGYPRARIPGNRFSQYLAPESIPPARAYFTKTLERIRVSSDRPYKIICKNGEERTAKIKANRIQDSDGNVKIVAQILDITDQLRAEEEKKQLQAQLIHSQKMEAIGTLAGGVAHDFNNLLMGIQGYLSLIRLDMEPDNPGAKYIQGIEDNVMSAANLTEQLLGFARKGKYTLRPTSLNEIVEKSARMFTRTRKEIKVHKRCQADIWKVEVDQTQIEQVLINLYLNAWHAMPDGGDLYVQTENVFLSDTYCRPYKVKGGQYVKISVTDTGVGMAPETMERIFEPFFTTREMGQGTGLGLASAYGIIKNHNGIIRVYSEKGHGATFNIYLPASAAEAPVAELKIAEPKKGTETILLVDDEEGPLMVQELMLKELGYKVIPAKSGREALALYRENMQDFDLVALDMIMPEMSGRETFQRLKQLNPAVKILLVSGYSINHQVEELMALGCEGFIQKPFDLVLLSHELRAILERRPAEQEKTAKNSPKSD